MLRIVFGIWRKEKRVIEIKRRIKKKTNKKWNICKGNGTGERKREKDRQKKKKKQIKNQRTEQLDVSYIGTISFFLHHIPNRFGIISGTLIVFKIKCVTFCRFFSGQDLNFMCICRMKNWNTKTQNITHIIHFIFKMTIRKQKWTEVAPNWLAIKYTCATSIAFRNCSGETKQATKKATKKTNNKTTLGIFEFMFLVMLSLIWFAWCFLNQFARRF